MRGVVVGPAHANVERLQRAHQHPAGVRVELRAQRRAPALHLPHQGVGARDRSTDEVAVAADIFRQREQRQVGAVQQRLLEFGAEQGVVDHHRRAVALPGGELVRDRLAGGEVDEAVGGVGGCLHQDHRHAALGGGRVGCPAHGGGVEAVGEAEGGDAELRHLVGEQRLGAAIERAGVDDRVARAQEGKAGGGDRGHAAGEDRAALRLVPDGEPVLQDLHVGVVEAGIDEPRLFPRPRLAPPGGEVEELLALLGIGEDEGRGQKHRRLQRAFRHGRRIAVAHHQRLGVQAPVGDAVLVVAVVGHGRGSGGDAGTTV